MNRRDFLRKAVLAPATFAFRKSVTLFADSENNDRWRTFEVTTSIEVLRPSGSTRIWVPAALIRSTPYQRTLANTFHCEGGSAKIIEKRGDALGIVVAQFPAGVRPIFTVKSQVAIRNWAVPLSGPHTTQTTTRTELEHYLRPTKLLPTDGIVREKAIAITRTSTTDIDKARAIYDWIVENTYRNPKTRGCGTGNIRFMLESGDLGGKCADLNALYVGLARAAGLPARDVYGIRVAKSERGYKSLGSSSDTITKAQHCRAEVYLSEYGWVPLDPADVRKVMLEEPPGNRPPGDEMVNNARARLFGSWEMNWMAYNFAHDVVLPGSSAPPLAFMMYPQAETDKGRLDSLDPDSFRYEIRAKEMTPNHVQDKRFG
jgi:transglutaminase-like putative cysteine protease